MAENFQKAIEDRTLEEAQAEIRRAWDMWREMDDLHDQACDWAIAANSLRDALQARVEEAETEVGLLDNGNAVWLKVNERLIHERDEARAQVETLAQDKQKQQAYIAELIDSRFEECQRRRVAEALAERRKKALERRVRPFLKRVIEATKPYHENRDWPDAAEMLFNIYEDAVMARAAIEEEGK